MSELTVSQIFNRLAHGELSNLSLVDKNSPGQIKDKYHPAILMQLNKAMRDVFTRFLLSQKEVIINTTATRTHYYLRNEFAVSNTQSTSTKYVDDTQCDNFNGDVAKILNVYDGMGRELYLNRLDEPLSVFTPQFDCLQITANHQTDSFFVIFQALHPRLTLDPDSILNIPPSLEDPLLLLIASKVYGAINGDANSSRSLQYMQQYEASLIENEVRDMASTSEGVPNSKLDRAGFI